jgi:NADPH:quinone reductase-like Zn-dependent oxidoreductase
VRAIVQSEYGDPLEVLSEQTVDAPVAAEGEVLVRVRAASVNPYDWHYVRGVPYVMRAQAGLRRPKHTIPGADVAGVVETAGDGVTSMRSGDEVYGFAGMGAFAEFVSIAVDQVGPKPTTLDFGQAASVPLGGITALQLLREGGLSSGQSVLIVGASGGVGTFAVQLAKHLGAEVTGVCSTDNLELVRSLGADRAIDYTREDFAEGGDRYDVVVQLGGTDSPARLRQAATPKGTVVLSSGESPGRLIGPIGRLLQARIVAPFVGQRILAPLVKETAADLAELRDLIDQGVVRPVVTSTHPLRETPELVRRVESGHTRGKLVVRVSRPAGRGPASPSP